MRSGRSDVAVYDIDYRSGQPYPLWSDFRTSCPVAPTEGIGFSDRTQYHVTTWADVETVLRDGDRFSASINTGVWSVRSLVRFILPGIGREGTHRSVRNLVAGAFFAFFAARTVGKHPGPPHDHTGY